VFPGAYRQTRARSAKQAKSALAEKNGSLPSPTTNRRPVGDIGAWGKPENSGRQAVLQSLEAVFALNGDAVPKPLGFIALGQQWLAYMSGGLSTIVPPVGRPRSMRGGTGKARPTIAAAESALRSHPCGALSSAQLPSVSPNDMRPSRDIQ
jgi:hypothetical protein